jgi:hypothetical protein
MPAHVLMGAITTVDQCDPGTRVDIDSSHECRLG